MGVTGAVGAIEAIIPSPYSYAVMYAALMLVGGYHLTMIKVREHQETIVDEETATTEETAEETAETETTEETETAAAEDTDRNPLYLPPSPTDTDDDMPGVIPLETDTDDEMPGLVPIETVTTTNTPDTTDDDIVPVVLTSPSPVLLDTTVPEVFVSLFDLHDNT
jgi:cytoskeletal protein RodZ